MIDLSVPVENNEQNFVDDANMSKKQIVKKKWNQIKRVRLIYFFKKDQDINDI